MAPYRHSTMQLVNKNPDDSNPPILLHSPQKCRMAVSTTRAREWGCRLYVSCLSRSYDTICQPLRRSGKRNLSTALAAGGEPERLAWHCQRSTIGKLEWRSGEEHLRTEQKVSQKSCTDRIKVAFLQTFRVIRHDKGGVCNLSAVCSMLLLVVDFCSWCVVDDDVCCEREAMRRGHINESIQG